MATHSATSAQQQGPIPMCVYRTIKNESVIKVQSDRSDLKRHMRDTEQKLQHERQDHRDVNPELSCQFKSVQGELSNKVKRLEKEVCQLKEELALCQDELAKEKREREQVGQEKDLQHELENMEISYENILHVAEARHRWKDKNTTYVQDCKEMLLEFGLKAEDI